MRGTPVALFKMARKMYIMPKYMLVKIGADLH